MSIEIGIRSALINDADVTAVISSRVYPGIMPHGYTLPAIVYQRISSERPHTLDQGNIGRVFSSFQIDCYAESYSTVRDLADKVRLVLDGFSGSLGGEADVGGIHLMSDRDLFEEETELYRVTHDYLIPYFETI